MCLSVAAWAAMAGLLFRASPEFAQTRVVKGEVAVGGRSCPRRRKQEAQLSCSNPPAVSARPNQSRRRVITANLRGRNPFKPAYSFNART